MVDVTVRGAGIFGLSVAWACAKRGARVQVIDPNGPGAGSSGGVVGALAPHVPENWNAKKAFQLESLLQADAFWAEITEMGGKPSGYIRSGRVQPVADDKALALARQRAITAKELWGSSAEWRVQKCNGGVWAAHNPTGWVIHDTLSALIHPRQSITALVAALSAKGVTIRTDALVQGRIVWTTGVAGLEALNAEHPRLVGVGVKGQAAVLDYDARGEPQLFVDGLHIIPHLDGTVAIGSTTERDYADATTTDDQLDALIQKARSLVPALGNASVLSRWAGARPRSRSRAPMLGSWPGKPDHYIANGGFKIGFGMAPKVGDVMADLLLEGCDTIPDAFNVSASF